MSEQFLILEFRPLYLTLDQVGPFTSLYTIDFTDSSAQPCNFYLMASKNGFGKTTALEMIARLHGLLGKKELSSYGHEDLDFGNGRAQLDVRARVLWEGREQYIVLSILAGQMSQDLVLKSWASADIHAQNASGWHRCGFASPVRGRYEKVHRANALIDTIWAAIDVANGIPPESFMDSAFHLPTVLSFSAYRDIPAIPNHSSTHDEIERGVARPKHWGYSVLNTFDEHSRAWADSLDNLLVWLKWISDDRFERARRVINENVFETSGKILKDVRRDPPEAIIETSYGTHRLDRLSSGEKNLVQVFLRIGAHMTKNTIVLIDELDVHLHLRLQHTFIRALKNIAASKDVNFTVIASTHSTEILQVYESTFDIKEDGIIKGGHLISAGMSQE
jgi:ABC-type molybdenum transport system ATPase subunit/photorepair protein PhrA